MPVQSKKRSRRPTSSRNGDKFKRSRVNEGSFFISDDKRGFLLTCTVVRLHTYNFVLAELQHTKEDPDAPVVIKAEIYNTTVFDSSEARIAGALEYMARELCKGRVNIDDPLDFAMTLGGTIHGRVPLSTPSLPKTQLH